MARCGAVGSAFGSSEMGWAEAHPFSSSGDDGLCTQCVVDDGARFCALGAQEREAPQELEHKLQDEEDASEGNGGYTFDTPEHKEQLKAQRQQLWQCEQLPLPDDLQPVHSYPPGTSCRLPSCPFPLFPVGTHTAMLLAYASPCMPPLCTPAFAGLKHVGSNMFRDGEQRGFALAWVRGAALCAVVCFLAADGQAGQQLSHS